MKKQSLETMDNDTWNVYSTTPEKEDWEIEFDRQFKDNDVDGFIDATSAEIKQFICELLAKQKEEIIKKLEGLMDSPARLNKDIFRRLYTATGIEKPVLMQDYWNLCIDDCIEAIKQT